MTVTYGTRTGTPTWSADSDTFTRLQLDQGFSSLELIAAITSEGPVGGRPAFGPGGAFYLATDQGVLYYDTGSAWVVAGRVVIGTQVVQAAASQVASLTEWRNATGSVLGKVAVDGSLYVDKLRFATAALNNLTVVPLLNGLTNFGATFGYRTTVDGWCEIQGLMSLNGAGGSGSPVSVDLCAAGAFPSPSDGQLHAFTGRVGFTGFSASTTGVDVLSTGLVRLTSILSSAGDYVAVDGIRYYVGG